MTQRKLKQIFPNCSISFSKNRFQPHNLPSHAPSPDPSFYQPGSCIQICHSHWAGRIRQPITEKKQMGSWTGQTYRLKENRSLTVITAYCPCAQNYTSIAKLTILTVNKQQICMQLDDTGAIIIPRNMFMDDLVDLIKELEQDPSMMIVLLINVNSSVED
jgi:hypothetical protein